MNYFDNIITLTGVNTGVLNITTFTDINSTTVLDITTLIEINSATVRKIFPFILACTKQIYLRKNVNRTATSRYQLEATTLPTVLQALPTSVKV